MKVVRSKILCLVLVLILSCSVFTGCGNDATANKWLTDSGAPTSSTKGIDGDMYLNTSNYDLYQMQDGEWIKIGNIAGTDGKDAKTPLITISEDGYWVIDGKKTKVLAKAQDGKDGKDGQNGKDGNNGKDGKDGKNPTIEINEEGYWVINGVVTEFKATVTNTTLEGDGQEFYTLAPSTLTFRSQEPLNEFQEVKVNGETVDPSNYTLTEGSTIVTFSIDYLKTLSNGNYDIDIVSKKNTVSGGFNVAEPEKNEHGFYYNQPYTAYVSYFSENWVFFIREGGTMDVISLSTGGTDTASYTFDNDILTVNSRLGVFTATVSEKEIYCNELATSFKLGNELIAADEDYIYVYKEELGGYEVNAIDKTKSEYGDIKTGINGYPTVKLEDYMFGGNTNLKTAPKIPNSVTTIGKHAFHDNQLTSVTIPNSVTTIGKYAFENNKLTSVTIPNSVTTIEYSAFQGNQLTSVTLGNSVEEIDGHAFENNQLTSVTIPSSVKKIGIDAFSNNQLTSVTIGNSVEEIDAQAFYNNNLTSVTIPNSVTTIGNFAFQSNQLTSVTIPNSVTTIGEHAFSYNQLTSVTIGDSVTTIGYSAFSSNQLTSVTLGNSVEEIGGQAFWGNQLTSVTIPSSVKKIGDMAFHGNQLTSVTIKGKKSLAEFERFSIIPNYTPFGSDINITWQP